MFANQRGIAHLILILILLIAIAVGVYLVSQRTNFLPKAFFPESNAEPTVEIKSEYKNPFKKDSQYVNPFDEYKSPFLNFGGGSK